MLWWLLLLAVAAMTAMATGARRLSLLRRAPTVMRLEASTLASWRAWMPQTPRRAAMANPNHSGTAAEWREWVWTQRRSSSSTAGDGEEDDGWRSFEFGSFASHMGPTAQQRRQMEKLQKLAPPAEIDPLWAHLSDDDVIKGIEVVKQYVTAERQAKFKTVLDQRTNFVRFLFHNPINVNNVWACLRTFDTFGLQYTNVVTEELAYHTAWRKQTMTQALGAQKWLSLKQESDTTESLRRLKEQGYRIVATDLHESSVSANEVDWTAQKTVIVLGNEKVGISDAVRAEADVLFFMPMKGFAESLNVSAFSAAMCGLLEHRGALDPALASMSESERNRILLTWLSRSSPASLDVMKRHGIDAGMRLWDSLGSYTTKP